MKKTLIAGIVCLFLTSYSNAVSISSMFKDIKTNTRFTAFEGLSEGYFQSMKKGSRKKNQGGLLDHVFTYRKMLSASVGYINSFTSNDNGTIVGGPTVLVDGVMTNVFPEYVDFIHGISSPLFNKLLEIHFVNLYGGWQTDNGAFDWGWSTGISVKF